MAAPAERLAELRRRRPVVDHVVRMQEHYGTVKGNLQANNGDALLVAARAGQGLVYEPSFILGDDLRAGALVPLALDHPPVELDGVYVVYPSNRRPPARLRAFVDWIAERCAGVPPWDRGLALD